MQLDITQQDREDLAYALGMRICSVETGTTTMRANDAINSGQSKLVRPLSESQRALISRHEALIKRILTVR